MKSFLWLALAAACFQGAYASIRFPAAGFLIFGYAYFLVRLTDQPTVRRAFYFGLTAGFLCYAPQLFFLWNLFGPAAIVLWLVLAFWIGLFAGIVCGSIRRWGKGKAAWAIPFVWTGIEYFRSELYYLKFSWLNVGYALQQIPLSRHNFIPLTGLDFLIGMYGVGFLVFGVAALAAAKPRQPQFFFKTIAPVLLLTVLASFCLEALAANKFAGSKSPLSIVGVQMEFPPKSMIPKMLDLALAKNTKAQIFVLSEYTLDGPVPASLKNWCRERSRFLVVGGEELLGTTNFYDTAFVVGTNGEIVFQQAKCVPIQFFRDGLPAPKQAVWNSPWGRIGICICYDLSYTRVTDELVRQGAQLLIVPTMDVAEWGRHEHELHWRVAPVRAMEYDIPIFRLASSGISQAVTGGGQIIAQAPMPGSGAILSAQLRLPSRGSLPLDRRLAPLCTGITGVVMVVLLCLNWNDRRVKLKGA